MTQLIGIFHHHIRKVSGDELWEQIELTVDDAIADILWDAVNDQLPPIVQELRNQYYYEKAKY